MPWFWPEAIYTRGQWLVPSHCEWNRWGHIMTEKARDRGSAALDGWREGRALRAAVSARGQEQRGEQAPRDSEGINPQASELQRAWEATCHAPSGPRGATRDPDRGPHASLHLSCGKRPRSGRLDRFLPLFPGAGRGSAMGSLDTCETQHV